MLVPLNALTMTSIAALLHKHLLTLLLYFRICTFSAAPPPPQKPYQHQIPRLVATAPLLMALPIYVLCCFP
jgi:hypothetical protein